MTFGFAPVADLVLHNVSKMFGGLRAVPDLDLEVPNGKILSLVMGTSEVVTVLDCGEKIAEGETDQTLALYAGRGPCSIFLAGFLNKNR